MNLLQEFKSFIEKEALFRGRDRLLVAVSGGVDSVVLCELCYRAGFDFAMAHCNFQLRDAESDADEEFVKQLASHYNVKHFTKKFETSRIAAENKISIQLAARQLRYAWFHEILDAPGNEGYDKLLTAHHANDNVETVLMNFFRGTGMAGMQGILPKSGTRHEVARPLLFAWKAALLHFAEEQGLAFREDVSNQSDKYTRNFFRLNVLPLVKEVFPQADENLLANIHRFRESNRFYQFGITLQRKKLIEERRGEWFIPVEKLRKIPGYQALLFEILKDHHFTPAQTDEAARLMDSDSGKHVDSQSHRILRNRNWLVISKIGNETASCYLLENPGQQLDFGKKSIALALTAVPANLPVDPNIAMLDFSCIRFPLLLRKWKQGDYFYPLGMPAKKKLSRFFIDKKLSITEKENTWVLEMDKKIVWVLGLRIDDRFKVTAKTSSVLCCKLSSPE